MIAGLTELRELGAGAQGRVVLARVDATDELVAVKELPDHLLSDEQVAAWFRNEAAMLGRVAHPNVARLLGYVEAPEGAAILMEAVNGISLRRLMDREGALPPEAALAVLKGSLLGLAAAHAVGVVHRDYKPANVIVQDDGCSKLIDFGVAALTGQGSRSGTPAYMAPEQWAGQPAAPTTDLYAATCVYVETVTGRRPYTGDVAALRVAHTSAPVPMDDVPDPVRPLVSRGMAKDPAARLWDAAQFVTELETIAADAYGPQWERHGQVALGAAAAVLAAAFPTALIGTSASASTGTMLSAGWSATEGGAKGLLAKIGGAKVAGPVAGVATAGAIATWLLWPSEPPYRHAWNNAEIKPISGIWSVPGGFLVRGVNGAGRAEIVGLDGRTGRIRWRHPIALPGGPDPESNELGTVEGRTVVFNSGHEEIAAADVVTGKVHWTHRFSAADSSVPYWCGNTRVCFIRIDYYESPSDPQHHRVRVLDGATGRLVTDSPELGPSPLGDGLISSRDHAQLVRINQDGKVLWRREVSQLFGPDAAIDIKEYVRRDDDTDHLRIKFGGNWELQLKGGRYVGEIGDRSFKISARRKGRLSSATVAALDAATGRTLWSRPGWTVFCGGLGFDIDHPVRCRRTGQLEVTDPAEPAEWRLRNINVTVEGFDPATGRTRWSWPAGQVRGLVVTPRDHNADDVIRVDDTRYLIRAPAGRWTLLNLDTGPRPVEGTPPVGWCWKNEEIRVTTPSDAPVESGFEWPCGAEGRAVDMPATLPDSIVSRSGDVSAWSSDGGIRAVVKN